MDKPRQVPTLPHVVRAFALTDHTKRRLDPDRPPSHVATKRHRSALFIDTETTTDEAQNLLVGYCELATDGVTQRRWLFYEEQLEQPERQEELTFLRAFADRERIDLVDRATFVRYVLCHFGYTLEVRIVGFNLFFDLPRLAVDAIPASGKYLGGFTLILEKYRSRGKDGRLGPRRPTLFLPKIRMKHLDSKRSFIEMLPPRRSRDAYLEKTKRDHAPYRGNFVDLRAATFALSNIAHSLASAGKAFGARVCKMDDFEEFGVVNERSLTYLIQDVEATASLYEAVEAEYRRHPIDLDLSKALSPASIGKAYFAAMGLRPVLERQPDFSFDDLGRATQAYIGARAEAMIVKELVPVTMTDVTSMYPTVNVNMDLWSYIIAERIEMIESTELVRALLDRLTVDDLFLKETWRSFVGFVEVLVPVEPASIRVPYRAPYREDCDELNVGFNHVSASSDTPIERRKLLYPIPDAVAAKVLFGSDVEIVRAWTLRAVGVQPGLRPVKLRGAIEVDPRTVDLFKVAIETRQEVKNDSTLPKAERDRLSEFLKVFSNATQYGVFMEMNQRDIPEGHKESVTVFADEGDPFETDVAHPEDLGRYCFPPFAALTTSAAHLVFALAEYEVNRRGGTHAMGDTDSLCIVSTRDGGLVPCNNGPYRMPDGRDAILALSWAQVDEVASALDRLHPYDQTNVKSRLLKIEDVNYEDLGEAGRGERRQVYYYGIAAKRYALLIRDDRDRLAVATVDGGKPKVSEHGLGYLLDPYQPAMLTPKEHKRAKWIADGWTYMVATDLGEPVDEPTFLDEPAAMTWTVTTPKLREPFARMNRKRPYWQRVKPGSFMLRPLLNRASVQVAGFSADAAFVAAFTKHARDIRVLVDLENGQEVAFMPRAFRDIFEHQEGAVEDAWTISALTFRERFDRFQRHYEAKSAQPDGTPCDEWTRGLLVPRRVLIGPRELIGKEANRVEEVAAKLRSSTDPAVQATYVRRDEPSEEDWRRVALPVLRMTPPRRLRLAGVPERTLRTYRADRPAIPHETNRAALWSALVQFAREVLGSDAPSADRSVLAAFPGRPRYDHGRARPEDTLSV